MGDMGDIFRANDEFYKERRAKRAAKFEPVLKEIGAEFKSEGVYMLGDYLLYPTKGFAMHKKTYKKMSLNKFIQGRKGAVYAAED